MHGVNMYIFMDIQMMNMCIFMDILMIQCVLFMTKFLGARINLFFAWQKLKSLYKTVFFFQLWTYQVLCEHLYKSCVEIPKENPKIKQIKLTVVVQDTIR